jgi:hypothetical protein
MDKTQGYLSKIKAKFFKSRYSVCSSWHYKKGNAKNGSYSPTNHTAFVANTTIVGEN